MKLSSLEQYWNGLAYTVPYGMTVVVVTSFALWRCTPLGPVDHTPPPVIEQPDAGCPEMCAHLRALGCAQAKPTPAGASCEKVCTDTMAEGYDVHPGCVAAVKDCSEVDRASQGCERR